MVAQNNVRITRTGEHAEIALIKIRGPLDTLIANYLREEITALMEDGIFKYLIHLELLEYVSSAGIELFFWMEQELLKHHGKVVFAQVPEKIYKLFTMIGVSARFPIKRSVNDAMEELYAR